MSAWSFDRRPSKLRDIAGNHFPTEIRSIALDFDRVLGQILAAFMKIWPYRSRVALALVLEESRFALEGVFR